MTGPVGVDDLRALEQEERAAIEKIYSSPQSKEMRKRPFLERYAYICSDRLGAFNVEDIRLKDDGPVFCSVDNGFPLWIAPALYPVPVKYIPFEIRAGEKLKGQKSEILEYERLLGCTVSQLDQLVSEKKVLLVSSPYDQYAGIISLFLKHGLPELGDLFFKSESRPIEQFLRVPYTCLLPLEHATQHVRAMVRSSNALFYSYGGPRTAYFYCSANATNPDDEGLHEFANIILTGQVPPEAVEKSAQLGLEEEAIRKIYASMVLHQINSFGQVPMAVFGSILSDVSKLYDPTINPLSISEPELDFLGLPGEYLSRILDVFTSGKDPLARAIEIPSFNDVIKHDDLLDHLKDRLIGIVPRLRSDYLRVLRENGYKPNDDVGAAAEKLDERVAELNSHVRGLVEPSTVERWAGIFTGRILPYLASIGAAVFAVSATGNPAAAAFATAGTVLDKLLQEPEVIKFGRRGWMKFKSLAYYRDALSYEIWRSFPSRGT